MVLLGIIIMFPSIIGVEQFAVTRFAANNSSSVKECVVEKDTSPSYVSYNISHCETVTCREGKDYDDDGPSCNSAVMDTLLNLTCDGGAMCYGTQVSNIQDGGTILCRGGDACSASRFVPALEASYTHICDNPMAVCPACEGTTFPGGLGPQGTLLCGRNFPCEGVKLGVSIEHDPDLCVLCAFSRSCLGIQDVNGRPAEPRPYHSGSGWYPFLMILGNGCGPSDLAKLRDFYWDVTIPKIISWKTWGGVVLMIFILRACVGGCVGCDRRRWPHVCCKGPWINIFGRTYIHRKSLSSPHQTNGDLLKEYHKTCAIELELN